MDADVIVFLACGFSAVGLLVVSAFYSTERKIMGVNETLLKIKANLTEATAELVAKVADLKAQLAAAGADVVLLSEVEELAQGLADIVDNQPVEEPAAEESDVAEAAEVAEVAETEAVEVVEPVEPVVESTEEPTA